ncbi:MAG: hypothetical protein WEA34_06735 [Gemmatimonadota bacterium]
MGELVFFAVIILFTILEAVAKRKKKREAEEEGGDEGESWTPAPVERQPKPKAERRPRVERGSSSSTDRGMPQRGAGREGRSETMIPADLWEEIAGLASGQTPRRRPEPRDMDTEEARSLEPLEVERIEDDIRPVRTFRGARVPSSADAHPVHRSHLGYGTDPSERAPSEQDWRPAERGNRNAERVRAMLRGSEGTDALKQAVILREVLGPPVSMKVTDTGD